MAYLDIIFSAALGGTDIGGDGNVVYFGDGNLKELSPVDLSIVHQQAPPKGGTSSFGGSEDTCYYASTNAPKARIYELARADFSVVRFADVIVNTSQGCGGDVVIVWTYDVGLGRLYKRDATDFSSIADVNTGGLSRCGGKWNVCWMSDAGPDHIYERNVNSPFAILQNAHGPSTLPTGAGGDPMYLWHHDANTGLNYLLDPGTPAAYNPTTLPATNIQDTTADGNGFLADPTNVSIIGFQWGVAPGVYIDNVQYTGPFYGGDFSLEMSPLLAGTTYYFRAMIYNTLLAGWRYGAELSFTTLQPLPDVVTRECLNITETSLDAQGEITDVGGDPSCDERGFVYDTATHANPGNIEPGLTAYGNLVKETGGAYGLGLYTLAITGTTPTIIYIRAYVHNSYGYRYGDEIMTLANPNGEILYPISDYSKGIRFDTSPGGNYPNPPYSGTIDHWVLVFARDSTYVAVGTFGTWVGHNVYERNYYNNNMHTDLYTLTNPANRTENVIKIKYKARFIRTSYPYGKYQRHLFTHGVRYDGAETDIGATSVDICEIFYTNPNTGLPWTIAELDDLIAGASVGEGGGWGIPGCDYLNIFVLRANAALQIDGCTDLGGANRRLWATVLEDEGEICTEYFEWGATVAYGNTTPPVNIAKGVQFTADINIGALPSIHYRGVITTDCGETFYSADREYPVPAPASFPVATKGTIPHRLASDGYI